MYLIAFFIPYLHAVACSEILIVFGLAQKILLLNRKK